MRHFDVFKIKKVVYALMRLFIKIIPLICLLGVFYICWDCITNTHISLLHVIAFVINLLGLILFSYVLFCDYFSKIFLSHKKAENIIVNAISYIFVFSYLVLFICGYLDVIKVYRTDYPNLNYTFIILTILSFCLYFIKNRVLQYSTARFLIAYRIALVAIITITSLLYIFLSIKSFFLVDSISNYISLSTALLSVWIVYLSLYHNFTYINYKRSQYLLFLRNFSMDEQLSEAKLLNELDSACNEYRLFLMRIGNPRTVLNSSFGKTYYLRTKDWKEQLQIHIKDAKIVFAVISHSDGLFWEIFNHIQYSSKYIYHILDIDKLREDLKEGKYSRIKHTKMGGILYFICTAYNGPFALCNNGSFCASFIFDNSRLIISSNIDEIIRYMYEPDNIVNTDNLSVINLEQHEDSSKIFIIYENVKYLINNSLIYTRTK